jgi:putative hemolysin
MPGYWDTVLYQCTQFLEHGESHVADPSIAKASPGVGVSALGHTVCVMKGWGLMMMRRMKSNELVY